MNRIRTACLILLGVVLVLMPTDTAGAHALMAEPALPDSPWWLVLHDQCDDTLHWISPLGEQTSISRPRLPDEADTPACSSRALHISQNGRYLVQIAPLVNGRVGIGFYDLQTGTWLDIHQTQPDEFAVLGGRYSSDNSQRIAIGFANDMDASSGWRVILFDMTTGLVLDTIRSDGPEIADFVGGEFLADARTVPYVTLLTPADGPDGTQVHIRLDSMPGDTAPLGAIVWYLDGAPGVGQALISGPYTATDMDMLPNGQAIFAYQDPDYPVFEPPPDGDPLMVTATNAVGLLLPATVGESPPPQLYFADGASLVYGGQWGADGRIVLFRRMVDEGYTTYWVRYGTATLLSLDQQVVQAIGVPDGFVYATDENIYYVSESVGSPIGPIFGDSMLSTGAAFVWASTFGNPPLTLDTPQGAEAPAPTLP
ncbi:MAG: hypothetical protein ACOCX3_04245, partial [Chloroflexota bacterium]